MTAGFVLKCLSFLQLTDKCRLYIIIQQKDAGAGAKRARRNSSLPDAHILKHGEDTEGIPDSYVIFITENDRMKGNQPSYSVERYITIGEKKGLFGDGSHIIYVNGTYRGDDETGIMYGLSCTDPDIMNDEELARKARYFRKGRQNVIGSYSRLYGVVP